METVTANSYLPDPTTTTPRLDMIKKIPIRVRDNSELRDAAQSIPRQFRPYARNQFCHHREELQCHMQSGDWAFQQLSSTASARPPMAVSKTPM